MTTGYASEILAMEALAHLATARYLLWSAEHQISTDLDPESAWMDDESTREWIATLAQSQLTKAEAALVAISALRSRDCVLHASHTGPCLDGYQLEMEMEKNS